LLAGLTVARTLSVIGSRTVTGLPVALAYALAAATAMGPGMIASPLVLMMATASGLFSRVIFNLASKWMEADRPWPAQFIQRRERGGEGPYSAARGGRPGDRLPSACPNKKAPPFLKRRRYVSETDGTKVG
jgi:hypothetical protein